MAQKDEILVKYTADIGDFEKKLDSINERFRKLRETGEASFAGFGSGAKDAGDAIDKTANKAQQAAPKFNALANSISQLGREAPAFAMNLNTGFLAISNNLPALFDAIKQITESNKTLAREGKQTESVLSQIGKSLFSLNTFLSVGVTLLTIYGSRMADYVVSLISSNKQLPIFIKFSQDATKEIKSQTNALIARNKQLGIQITAEKEGITTAQATLDKERKNLAAFRATLKVLEDTTEARIRDRGVRKGVEEEDILGSDSYAEELRRRARLNKEDLANVAIYKQKVEAQERYVEALEVTTVKTDELNAAEAATEAREKAAKDREKKRKDELKAESEMWEGFEKIIQDADEKAAKSKGEELDNLRKHKKAISEAMRDADEAAIKQDKARLSERLKNQKLSFGEQYDLLVEQLNKGYITEEGFAQATQELNQKRVESYIMGVQAIANTLVGFAQLAGQNTEAGKALASAGAIIDSIAAAQLIFRAVSTATYLGPAALPLATVSAAGALAQGFARVQQINAVTIPQSTLTQPNFISAAATYKSAPQRGQASMGGPSVSARRFKDGVVDLDGPGTWISDSIPAYLSKGESVIPSYQTSKKKDDLTALWKSVPDYERFIQVQYVQPALKKQAQSFAENVSMSAGYNFNDKNIVKAINKNKPATAKDILLLTNEVAKQNRAQSFERKLKGNGR